jgi:hypothetical protein
MDCEDTAYQPEDREGKKLAKQVTMLINKYLYFSRMHKSRLPIQYAPPGQMPMCRCVMRPLDPTE